MKLFGIVALTILVACPAYAQNVVATDVADPSASPSLQADTDAAPVDPSQCELHVWASDQYESMSMGLLSGFGAVGAVIDQAGRGSERVTIKDLMADYLDPPAQYSALSRLNPAAQLGMPNARIVWHEDMLALEQRKDIKKIKGRLSESKAACYGELINGVIFYHRAAMYGSNLFGGFVYRDFTGASTPTVSVGKVKNPLEVFPPKAPNDVEAAKAELVDAWGKDFNEFVQKKLR